MVSLIWSEREKKSFPHCLNTYFSNFFLQKSLNGFFARPWWKQWLLTFLLLHPSFPSLHHSWLISLSKWFLTPSFSFQPFRPRPGLVVGATHCDRWNESSEKSHLLINPWGIQSVKKKIFFHLLSEAATDGRRGKKWAVIWRPFGVFLHRQLISAVRFVAVGSWGSTFCIYLQTQCSMSDISCQEKEYSLHCNASLKLNIKTSLINATLFTQFTPDSHEKLRRQCQRICCTFFYFYQAVFSNYLFYFIYTMSTRSLVWKKKRLSNRQQQTVLSGIADWNLKVTGRRAEPGRERRRRRRGTRGREERSWANTTV